MEKIVTQALELIERVAYHNYEWSNERGTSRRTTGVLEVDTLSMINAQFDQLTRRLDKMQANAIGMNSQYEDSYGGGYMSSEYNSFNEPPIEWMNYVNNRGNFNQRQPNNPYSNTYNPGWRKHPNFSWSNQQNQPINKQQEYKPPAAPGFQNRGQNFAQPPPSPQPQQPKLKMTMESMMEGFLAAQQQQNELIK
ncbi:hypothetical protein P3X46_013921 [Hevea brasiliensis]|uniref:LOB domain-containing protein n=1 Tax=Hevea brasiliensis TaxID=3981 RepID=A0ABQ9M519_HEVBR|nr:hypothetical protein P3X46_013921 [Hevea brasiliensis]